MCVVNSINYQTTCGDALLDREAVLNLKEDEVIVLMNNDGRVFITTYK